MDKKTLPGMPARAVFEVITTTNVVSSWLALYASHWTTRAGRRLAGVLPRVHQGPPSRSIRAGSPVGVRDRSTPTGMRGRCRGIIVAAQLESMIDLVSEGVPREVVEVLPCCAGEKLRAAHS